MGNHKVQHLSARQEEILRCIRLAITDQGDALTVAGIAEQVGLCPSSVHHQLGELEDEWCHPPRAAPHPRDPTRRTSAATTSR
ncbi:hypothetical protein [Streptomyces sp. Tu 4128]|uniref:LexA family protein n=1 Tax=Streptomyces sp. Tu 4128 TaxID=1120314 RepID=UPI001F121928|nr:hypothetical protein [Streptomyces sp. Tu 4128]